MMEAPADDIPRLISELLMAVSAALPLALRQHDDVAHLVEHCHRATLAWPACHAVAKRAVNRRGAILAGPLFTSAAFSWPMDDGRWLEPVLQINLSALGSLKGIGLGQGWLQIWARDQAVIWRLVPEPEVATAELTPLPSQHAGDFHQRLVSSSASDRTLPWLPGHMISGFKEPFFDYGHNELLYLLAVLLDDWSHPLPPSVRSSAEELRRKILEDEPWYGFESRAFGMINESDLSSGDAPPVLFVLEEGAPLRDSANGSDGIYVCYEPAADGGVTFSIKGANL